MTFRDQLAARLAARQAERRRPLVPVGESYVVDAARPSEAGRLALRLALGDGHTMTEVLHVERIMPHTFEVVVRTGWQEDDDR